MLIVLLLMIVAILSILVVKNYDGKRYRAVVLETLLPNEHDQLNRVDAATRSIS